VAKRTHKEKERERERESERAKRNVSGQLSDRTKPKKRAAIAEDTMNVGRRLLPRSRSLEFFIALPAESGSSLETIARWSKVSQSLPMMISISRRRCFRFGDYDLANTSGRTLDDNPR